MRSSLFFLSIILALSGCSKGAGPDTSGGGVAGSSASSALQGPSELTITDEISSYKKLPVMNDFDATKPAWAAPPASELWSVYSTQSQIKSLFEAKVSAAEFTELGNDWNALLALYPNGAIPQYQTEVPSLQKTYKVSLKLENGDVIKPSLPYWTAFADIHILVSPSGALYLGLINFKVFNTINNLMGLKITAAATPTILAIGGKNLSNAFNRAPYRFVLAPFVNQSAPFGNNLPAPASVEKKIDEIIPITQPALDAFAAAVTSLETTYACLTTTYASGTTGYKVCKAYVPHLKKVTNKHVLIPYKKVDDKIYRIFALNTITGGAVARIYINDPVIKNALLSTHPWLTY